MYNPQGFQTRMLVASNAKAGAADLSASRHYETQEGF
jgi:hypothetical protein